MNIQQILSELNKTMSDAEIGERIGASQSIVTRLRNGKHKTTSYERGVCINQLAVEKGIDIHATEPTP